MTFQIALEYFIFSLIIASVMGLVFRSKQEKIHPSLWYLVIIVFWFNLVFDLLLPIIMLYRFLFCINNPNYSIQKRIRLALLSIPAGYYFLIDGYDTFSDEKFWKPFRNVSVKLKQNLHQNKVKITKSQLKSHSVRVLSGFENRIKELKAF